MSIYYPFVFAVMAAYFLVIGFRVVVSKRPYLMPSRYTFALLLLAFSPQFVNSAKLLSGGMPEGTLWLELLSPAMFLCLLGYFWFQLTGYVVVGILPESFRQAIHASLEKHGQSFEERLSIIDLTSIGATLHVTVHSWAGSGQLRLLGADDPSLLSRIVAGVNDYYAEHDNKLNTMTPRLYVVMGLFLLAGAGVMLFYIS
ncbi:MAG: hypothetical protein AAF657_23485 [Acidobacteriota bacterium]